MWRLSVIDHKAEESYCIFCGEEVVVGRKDANILMQSDPSISRRHAVLTVTRSETNTNNQNQTTSLNVQDVSKLGSVLQGQQFKGETRQMHHGDIISFGTLGEKQFRAEFTPLLVTSSCIQGPVKRSVRAMVQNLGGRMMNEWRNDCNLLVMSCLSVTVKVISALVSLKLVVTPQYLEELIKCVQSKKPHPKPESYLPPLAESQLDPRLVSFSPDKRRQTLFKNKTFLFFSQRQHTKLSEIVERAGGRARLMLPGGDHHDVYSEARPFLSDPNTCVMTVEEGEQATQLSQEGTEAVTRVMQELANHNLRPISDPEIGYAVLYCSAEKYCNPQHTDFTQPTSSRATLVPQSLSQAPVIPGSTSQAFHTAPDAATALESCDPNLQVPPEILATDTEMDTSLAGARRGKKPNVGDVSRIDETRLEAQIKIEPESQVVPELPFTTSVYRDNTQEQSTSGIGRKRTREVVERANDDEKNSKDSSPRESKKKKTASPITEVKQEPVATRTRSRSRSLSPSPAKQRKPVSEPSEVEISPNRKQRLFGSSPNRPVEQSHMARGSSPDPVSSTQSRRSRIIKTESVKFNYDDIDDIDSIPTNRRRGRNRSQKQPEHTVLESEQIKSTAVEQCSESTEQRTEIVKQETCDEITDYDHKMETEKQHKNPNKSTSSPLKTPTSDSNSQDIFDEIPQSRSHSRRALTSNNNNNEKTQQEEKPENNIRTSEAFTPVTVKSEEASKNTILSPNNIVEKPTGFISTAADDTGTLPHCGKLSEFSAKIEDLPSNCLVVKETKLVARQYGNAENRDRVTQLGTNTCVWKGRVMKNFKKFKKITPQGGATDGLPTIIGGSDLEVHKSIPKDEVVEWFREEMQAESQRNEIEKIANEMFEWRPTTNRKGFR